MLIALDSVPPPLSLLLPLPVSLLYTHSLTPYCCPYPCPYCTLTPSLRSGLWDVFSNREVSVVT